MAWLSGHALPAPAHPAAAGRGADFASAELLAPGAPPGRPGWAWDFQPEEDRAVEARLGLLALLQGSQKEAARRVVQVAARSCLQGCRRDEQLVQRLRANPLQSELQRWAGLFARPRL